MYADLREWLDEVREMGELKEISEEVSWDEEMGALTYVAAKRGGCPALLFTKIKGYEPGFKVLFNMLGASINRVALGLGVDGGAGTIDVIAATRARLRNRIPPQEVSADKAPVNQNVYRGKEVDLTKIPVPKMWPGDGGRYLGTADVVITKDPETGNVNMGTYRQMVQGPQQVGFYASPGKDAVLHREKWWARGEPCPVVAVYGVDPALFMVGSQGFPKNVSEYDYAGGIMQRAVETVKGDVTGLPYPANAEIVVEGFSYPGKTKPEGPFGEFTGYYGRPLDETPVIDIECLRHRDDAILTCALMADHPSSEQNVFFSIIRSARIWDDLEGWGIPGIKGVYSHPAAAGGFGIVIVSMKQSHAGHASQVLALTAQCPAAAYYTKWIVAVDEDVDPCNMDEVLWAMSTRCSPVDDIDILRNTWSTWLDPTLNPPEERPYGSKALINACKEHKNIDIFAERSAISKEMYENIKSRWHEFGFEGEPFEPSILKDE